MTAAEAVAASRAAQGLPERLTDPTTVDRVLAVLTAGKAAHLLTAATAEDRGRHA